MKHEQAAAASQQSADEAAAAPKSLEEPPPSDLAFTEQQSAYRKAYLEQLRRRACPGCGEDWPEF